MSPRAMTRRRQTNENHLEGQTASQIKPVRADWKKALILKATLKGVTTEDIMKLTGWAMSAASSAIATDIVPRGYRVTVDEGVYMVPHGLTVVHSREML